MRQHRGASESTLTTYRLILTKLLSAVGETPGNYNAHLLRRGVERQTSRCGRSWAKLVITTVRMFLRCLVVYNLCDATLVDALPDSLLIGSERPVQTISQKRKSRNWSSLVIL